jgi:radical SAM superfamily enzyme YgiQ (UPF0313 family)
MQDKKKLIFNYVIDKDDFNPNFRPLAFGYIKSSLEKALPDMLNIKYLEGSIPEDEKADFLLISSLSPDWQNALTNIRSFRANNPSAAIIVGGQHITQLPETLPAEADFGILGEGEISQVLLVKFILEKNQDIDYLKTQIEGLVFFDKKVNEFYISNPKRLDFTQIPQPDWLAENGIKKTPYLLTSRGCPYNCTFCSSSNLWKKVSFQPAESIAEDISYLSKNFPKITNISILDDLFVADRKRLEKLYEILKEKNLLKRFTYACNVRADLVDEELCELMKKLNITYCSYGFESGNDRILKLLKPQGNCSVKTNIKAAKILKKYGFNVNLSVVVGTPTETKEELLKTYNLTIDLLKKGLVNDVAYNILTPMPGTHYWKVALENNIVEESNDFQWKRLTIFADFKHSSFDNFDDWLKERKKRNSVYLNEKYLPEDELYEIMSKYAKQRDKIFDRFNNKENRKFKTKGLRYKILSLFSKKYKEKYKKWKISKLNKNVKIKETEC